MRIFLTGATGFIGAHLVPELIRSGHQVVGLCRSGAGADQLSRSGAVAFPGDILDLGRLRAGADGADAVIHTAFNHDFTRLQQHSEDDRQAILALGDGLAGSDRPLLVTSGTGLVERTGDDGPVRETDRHAGSARFPRAATEEAADVLMERDVDVRVIRLPQVHDTAHFGRIGHHIRLARERGRVCYEGNGDNRLPAIHVSDAARLFGLALERGARGARYHAVAEEGVPMRAIAEAIGAGLNAPVMSIDTTEAAAYFGPLAGLASLDLAASGALTRQALGWTPEGPDLLTDLRQGSWMTE